MATTKQAGGVLQLDRQYLPDWTPKPPPMVDLTKMADNWLGPAFAMISQS